MCTTRTGPARPGLSFGPRGGPLQRVSPRPAALPDTAYRAAGDGGNPPVPIPDRKGAPTPALWPGTYPSVVTAMVRFIRSSSTSQLGPNFSHPSMLNSLNTRLASSSVRG